MTKIILCLLLAVSACSFKSKLENQTLKGHEELYSSPNEPKGKNVDGSIHRVVIAATNDIHGHYQPNNFVFEDQHNKKQQSIRIGGVDIIGAYFNILRHEYKNVLLMDSGDIFPGKTKNLKPINDFYSSLKYDAITVGLSDFSLKLPVSVASASELLKNFAKESKTPLLLSNLYELKTARVVEWPGTKPYLLKELNGVKVGIIGLIPDDLVTMSPVDNRVGLFVEKMLQSTLRQARLLRSLGAEIIVVLTHQGVQCGHDLATEMKLPLEKVNFEPNKEGVCEMKGTLGEYLLRLPPHLVDVVIGGRHHEKMANFFNETLILSAHPDGKSFSFAEFYVDTKTKKLLKEKTVAHQPVYFCREFFKETNDCFTQDTSVNHQGRIPAKFLGHEIAPDLALEKKFSKFMDEMQSNETTSIDFNATNKSFEADISYVPTTSQNSQLVVVDISGADLIKLLEEDFNQGEARNWMPSPFKVNGESLELTLNGSSLSYERSYKVLTDLEGIHHNRLLRKNMRRSSRTFMQNSWKELTSGEDEVVTKLSALETP